MRAMAWPTWIQRMDIYVTFFDGKGKLPILSYGSACFVVLPAAGRAGLSGQ